MHCTKNRPALACAVLAALALASACTRGSIAPDQPARVYHRPYDEVWDAVAWVILNDLGLVEHTAKKNRGYLETDWVHSFDAIGQTRWKIEASLKKSNDAVTVALVKTVQLRDPLSKKIRRYNQEDNKEPVGPNVGWSDMTAAERDIEELYRRIDLRLGE